MNCQQSSTKKQECQIMEINDTKAGMENIDKDRINSIILKHSISIKRN